ncbi:MAG: hypothetical protein M9894_16670 [Planctomycetes bacterium]|nr:hypothetical protein [Planctomycetota bacterium]
MKCPVCTAEINPTLVYCSACGVPLEVDAADILEDEERRREETRILQAVRAAKELLVTALFVLGATIFVRVLFLDRRTYDDMPAFRVPYAVIEEAGIDPPIATTLDPAPIPLPEEE